MPKPAKAPSFHARRDRFGFDTKNSAIRTQVADLEGCFAGLGGHFQPVKKQEILPHTSVFMHPDHTIQGLIRLSL